MASQASNRTASVQMPLGGEVHSVRLLWTIEAPKSPLLSGYADHGQPLAAQPWVARYSQKAASPIGIGRTQVLPIYALRNIPQVGETVIGSDAVDMVDVVNGPVARDMQPCQAVGEVVAPIDGDGRVSIRRKATCWATMWRSPPWDMPHEHTRFRVVVKKLAQSLRGKIGLSHDALQLLIGQRPASVSALRGLRYFSVEEA